jgi:pimeloyl-ACP methyl ester carboxylesterase
MAPIDAPVRALVRFLGRTGALRVFAAPLLRHPFAVDRSAIVALGNELRPRAFVAATEVALAYPADAIWSRITCPVSAMKGDRDAFVSGYDFERLAIAIPQLRTTVISDCAHFGNIERPAETLAALRPTVPE